MSQDHHQPASPDEIVGGEERRRRIIRYWDSALLASPHASTSHAHPDVAWLDNAIEQRRLARLLGRLGGPRRRCLDVGAGYGRFAPLFRRLYARVVMLEPAARLYADLVRRWGDAPAVRCIQQAFEAYTDPEPFDLVFASGVLYLYDDAMARAFAGKAAGMLAPRGLLVLRDFLGLPGPRVVPSAYVEGAQCHYREPAFWERLGQEAGLEVLAVERSKPRLALLRRGTLAAGLGRLGLTRALRCRLAARCAELGGSFSLRRPGVHTVFLALGATR
ncbi:MAG: class I SAM-dependent methyltransferase [Candidatus Brocadiia bacterium]